jgi:hypothetical protein
MKAIASIMLYSGMHNPKQELSLEESNDLLDRLSKVDTPSENEPKSKRGFNGFSASWETEKFVIVREGIIAIYAKNEYPHKCYKDNVGFEIKLREILAEEILKYNLEY